MNTRYMSRTQQDTFYLYTYPLDQLFRNATGFQFGTQLPHRVSSAVARDTVAIINWSDSGLLFGSTQGALLH